MDEFKGTREPTGPSIEWDTEERDDLSVREGHVRVNTMHLTTGLTTWMESVWGGVLSYIKTSTDVTTGEVIVCKALEKEPGAVPVRRHGTQNAASFNFWRPLRKLSLKVPEDRQFNVTPFIRQIDGVGTVFVFAMNQRKSVRRNLKEEAESEGAAPAAEKTAAAQQPAAPAPPDTVPPAHA